MNILNRLQAAVLAILMLGTLTGCGGGAASGGETGSGDPVRIATKPMTEQYILGEILGLLIEQAGYDVEITKGVGGGTSNIQPAMESGEFDLYPEYTSSGWVLVLDHQAEGVDDAEMFTRLQQEYEEKFHMTWVGKYGFNNTFTVAVRGDVAEQYGLETTSDLAGAAGELTFGGNPDYLEREDGFPTLCKTYGITKCSKVVRGGESRCHSVLLAALEASPEARLLAVQDGARPLVTPALIDRTVEAAAKCGAAAPAVPVKDTIKTVAEDGAVTGTPDRSTLRAVQTPQVFEADLLKAALQSALENEVPVTDDCSAVERLGKVVYLIDGNEENLKITTPVDLVIAEAILAEREGR